MDERALHKLSPGLVIDGDWFPGSVPDNIEVDGEVWFDSTHCFKNYYSREPVGLKVGRGTLFWRTAIAVEENGVLEVGEDCVIGEALLVSNTRVRIGSRVLIDRGVTITDSEFHPIEADIRFADTVALSPRGDRRFRPTVGAADTVIEDDVSIGLNAAVLKGVRVGRGAVIAPCALVIRDVPPGAWVAGCPARIVETTEPGPGEEGA